MKTIIIIITAIILVGCESMPTGQPVTTTPATAEPAAVTATSRPLPTATLTPLPSPPPESAAEVEAATPLAGSNSAGTTDAVLAEGIAIYRQNYCGVCHTLTVAGTRGTFGPSHDKIGLTAEQRIQDPSYHGTATTAEAYLMESLVDPQAYIVDGYQLTAHKMPPFTHLSDEALQAMVQMMLQQK